MAQPLSFTRKGGDELWVEAAAPPDTRWVLQASENLHLWIDIYDDVQGQFGYRFDAAGVTKRFFRLIQLSPPARPIRVVLLGDSTASECCGWGQGIYGYFKPNVTFLNYALPWTSTRTFLGSAEMDKLLVVKPDFVLVQFGYVDTGGEPERATSLPEFKSNLKTIVQTIRDVEGFPILITLHAARSWDSQGRVIPHWQDRNAVVREVATELDTYLIDLFQLTTDLYNELGESGCAYMILAGVPDWMHFSLEGAQTVSRVVANALPDALGPYLTGILDPPPKP